MAKLQMIVIAVILISAILVDFAAEARRCENGPCAEGYRCIAAHAQRRWPHHSNVCVARRCLHSARRGRCPRFQRRHRRSVYVFDRATMSCHAMRRGLCYRGGNHFSSMENCELGCYSG